jgi:hypothetical protein
LWFFKGNLVETEDKMPKIRQKTVQGVENFKETGAVKFRKPFLTNTHCGPQTPMRNPDSECQP